MSRLFEATTACWWLSSGRWPPKRATRLLASSWQAEKDSASCGMHPSMSTRCVQTLLYHQNLKGPLLGFCRARKCVELYQARHEIYLYESGLTARDWKDLMKPIDWTRIENVDGQSILEVSIKAGRSSIALVVLQQWSLAKERLTGASKRFNPVVLDHDRLSLSFECYDLQTSCK